MAKKMIGINFEEADAKELERRADSMHLSTSMYIREVLKAWVERGEALTLIEK